MNDTLVGTGNLAKRWGYTRQGVNKLMRLDDFPQPIGYINANRIPVWYLSQFAEFEKNHPETQSQTAKNQKIVGYFQAILKE